MAWYNKYRPENFDEVLGQDLVKSVLKNAIEKNLIKNAYLLSGPKGVGKTTIARIFANNLNDLSTNPEAVIDIIEMDAASNTGIDDVRQLINSANNPPISGKYKIYIIDEVHMLSKQAMNALLKIIEEPPHYLIFLFATTNPEKIIPTVLSRLTKLNLSSHTQKDVITKLEQIAKNEGLNIDSDSLIMISKRAEGSQRDAINLLETISSYGLDEYDQKTTASLLGLLPEDLLEKTFQYFYEGGDLNKIIEDIEITGVDPDAFLAQLFDYSLDQSLSGKSEYNNLIETLAKLISYRLPLSSIKSCFALVYSQLNSVQTPNTTTLTKAPLEQKPQPIPAREIKTEPKIIETPESPEKQIETNSKPDPLPESAPKKTTNQLDVNSINDFLYNLKNGDQCPPMLKMILSDLTVSDFDNGKMNLCVSNGIIENQVNSAKNSNWLKEKIAEFVGHTDFEFIVKMEKRAVKNLEPAAEPMEPIYSNPEPEMPPVAPLMDEDDNIIAETKEIKQLKKINSKIFYKIYKQLPAEIQDSKIPVYSKDIPEPEKNDDWSNEIESEFEFE